MSQIAPFPDFTPIDVTIRSEIERFTRTFPPYSDFNFTSLHAWDTGQTMAVSGLHNNLVFRMADYETGEQFYTFIGLEQVADTARELLGLGGPLRLIPEECAKLLASDCQFNIQADPDNHDYLLSTENLTTLHGNRNIHTRKLVNRFYRERGERSYYGPLDLHDPLVYQRMFAIFDQREASKGDGHGEAELIALKRMLAHSLDSVRGAGVWVDNQLEAFITYELLSASQAIAHFWKANLEHTGIYHYLLHCLSRELHTMGYQLLNFEQDLGIAGLRIAKQRFRPIGFLQKYSVALAEQEVQI